MGCFKGVSATAKAWFTKKIKKILKKTSSSSSSGSQKIDATPPVICSQKIDSSEKVQNRRSKHCHKCSNHGVITTNTEHFCPYESCMCTLCELTEECRMIMKDQQKRWCKQQEAAGEDEIPSTTRICDLCKNHGFFNQKKGHKGNCAYATCICDLCEFTNQREKFMKHNQRLQRWCKQREAAGEDEIPSTTRICDLCKNHGFFNQKKGHKGNCAYATCICDLCELTNRREKHMKNIQRLKRMQKDGLPSSESIDNIC